MGFVIFQKLTILPLLIYLQLASSADQVSLKLPDGTLVLGLREQITFSQRSYYSFRGIRYAVPMLGTNRWKDPQLLEFDSGSVSATNYGPPCPQFSELLNKSIGEEDCLFLNVFTPTIPRAGGRPGQTESSRSLLPVMVYLHGGGFTGGSGDRYGPDRFMKHDVILVTLNYRLGLFGFLSKGDAGLPGNYGLLDQTTALLWVRKYIRDFGGNPHRVTLFGHSAGAASVHLHTLSRLSIDHEAGQPLFHQAIIQSGSGVCNWAVIPRPWEFAEALAEKTDCPSGDTEALVQCLEEKTPSSLIEIQHEIEELLKIGPVIDGHSREIAFLEGDPDELMDAGAFLQMPILTGVTNSEGLAKSLKLLLSLNESLLREEDYWQDQVIPDFIQTVGLDPDSASDFVFNQYFDGVNFNDTKLAAAKLGEAYQDGMFFGCHWRMLEKLKRGSNQPVYNYVFSHSGPRSPSFIQNHLRSLRRRPTLWTSVGDLYTTPGQATHGDELYYLFSPVNQATGQANEPMTSGDEKVAETLTRLWVNFATRGSPDTSNLPGYPEWTPLDPLHMNYYNLTSGPAPMGQDFKKGESEFWEKTLPQMMDMGDEIDDLNKYHLLFWIFVGIAAFLLLVVICLSVALYRQRTVSKRLNV